MDRFVGSSSKIHLPMCIDNVRVDRKLRIWHNFFYSSTFSAVVIGLFGVMKIVNSSSKNVAACSPLFPTLQSLLDQWIHAGIIGKIMLTRSVDISVAADCPGGPCEWVANLQGSEHHSSAVFLRAGTRYDIGLSDVAFIAAAVLADAKKTCCASSAPW